MHLPNEVSSSAHFQDGAIFSSCVILVLVAYGLSGGCLLVLVRLVGLELRLDARSTARLNPCMQVTLNVGGW